MQGIEHHFGAGSDRAAEEFAGVVATIDGDRGAGVDNDAGFLHLLVGSGDVQGAIHAGLFR